MKILIVHNYHRSGSSSGDDIVFRKESEMLEGYGHKVIRFTLFNDEFDRVGFFKRSLLGMQIPWSVASYKRIKNIILEEKPDIAHIHNFFPLISPSIYYALYSGDIPIVQTLHDFRLLCGMAFFMRDRNICDECKDGSFLRSIKYGCFKNSKTQTIPVALMLKLHHILGTFKNKIDAYICLTECQKEIYLRAGFEGAKLFLKPNFVRDAYKPNGDRRCDFVLFVGRLGEEKGIGTLIEAWRHLAKIPLKIVGDGPEAENIRLQVYDLNLRNVEILGYRPYDECMNIMGKSRFLVMPSIWYETFGLTIVEAFSHAKPVIASNLGAMADIVKNGVTGLLFSPKDSEQLAEKVRWLWNSVEEYETMGRNARKEYIAKYTREKNYEVLVDIYEKAIELHGRRKQ